MSEVADPVSSFAYVAQNVSGAPLSGTIESPTIEAAAQQLNELQLRVTRLTAAAPRVRRLSASDFATMNHQLAFLTRSNLPIEKGLRLLAAESNSARLAATFQTLATDLEAGVPLDQALERRQTEFPPIYAAIVRAGIVTGSLPGALLNLNRHIELVSRLRAAVWRAVSYPLLLIVMLLMVLTFIGKYIVPHYERMISYRWMRHPGAVPEMIFTIASLMPLIWIGLAVLAVIGALVWFATRFSQPRGSSSDAALRIPMIGGVLRQNLLARWCDALQLCVTAGVALPDAIRLAAEIVGSPRLAKESNFLADQIAAGMPIDLAAPPTGLLPPTILNTTQLAAEKGNLPHALGVLSTLHQQAAELRLNALQNTLMPALLILVAAVMFFVILGFFQPMVSFF